MAFAKGFALTQADIDALRGAGDGSLSSIDFADALFEGDISFEGAEFGDGDVSFVGATFGNGTVNFRAATFGNGEVSFVGVEFGNGNVNFRDVRFGDGDISFLGATFGGGVTFEGATFGNGHVHFGMAKFHHSVVFIEAVFGSGGVNFNGASFGDEQVTFARAKFGEGTVSFRPAGWVPTNELVLDGARFTHPATLEVAADHEPVSASLQDARIEADLVVLLGAVVLDAGALTVRAPTELKARSDDVSPTLESLDNADITAPFRIDRRVDLRNTRWGDHDLTRIEIADTSLLPSSPRTARDIRSVLRGFVAGYGGRQRIAADSFDLEDADDLAIVERNYRDLRRQLEATGNHHTASDFYYGEMEARRRRASAKSVEHWLLRTYHVLSEYGTRAWRALAFWMLLPIIAAWLVKLNGVDINEQGEQVSFLDAWKFTLGASLSLFRPQAAPELSWFETVLVTFTRIVGPLLLALAALAVRNRTRRN